MLIATISDPAAASAAAGLSFFSIAILIFAILLIVAPLAIWHNVAKRRDEAKAQHQKTIAMLNAMNDTLTNMNDTLAAICDALEQSNDEPAAM